MVTFSGLAAGADPQSDQLVPDGEVRDYAELARLAHVTRARMSQIMSLTHLAPDIQEAIFIRRGVDRGNHPITLKKVLPATRMVDLGRQRRRRGCLRGQR